VAGGRGGGARSAVYISDLLLGLAVSALILGLAGAVPIVRPAMKAALLAGAVLAALYAIYLRTAIRLDLPFADGPPPRGSRSEA